MQFGLGEGRPQFERKTRVKEAVALLGLEGSLEQDPNNFDNGTRQRVAFARAVARQSSIILFDEPITNVTPSIRLAEGN